MSDARENKISRKRKLNTPNKGERKAKSPKKNHSVLEAAVNVEEDFPRGGAHPLTPLEIRQAKNEAEKDILFGVSFSSDKTKVKSKKKKKSAGDQTLSNVDDKLLHMPISRDVTVESLTFKKLSKGVLLLGIVEEVYEFEMVISLANNLSGCVHITDINPTFTSLLQQEEDDENNEDENVASKLHNYFPVGTMLKCVVVSTDSSKHGHSKIRLSINPENVNSSLTSNSVCPNMVISGYITSEEDHGYSVDLGIKGMKGFLLKKMVSENLKLGQVLDCIVSSTSSDKRMVRLQIDKIKSKTNITTRKEEVVFSGLLPGMLVKSTVKQVNSHGIVVTFLGGFEGCLDLLHLAEHGGNGEVKKTYPVKTKLVCRITYICPSTKTVGLSNLEHLVNGEAMSFSSHSIGDINEETIVTRLDQSKGLLLELTEELSGYAHISRLSDENVTKIDKHFKAGTKHSCRILSFNSMVGLALVTLEKSVLEQPFIRYQDIKPGVVVTGKIESLLKSGVLVSLSDRIRGYCQSLHYADVTLKHPEKKLYEGKTVKCRVLEVEAERKRLRLTHKKTLVNSELPVITHLSKVEVGMKTHGFITSIRDYGCIVHFYNNIHGLVPKTELGLKSSEDPANAFYVGQVVTCVVLSCSPVKQKLSLSFNTSAVPSSFNSKPLTPGTLVDVDIVGRTESGLDVQIKPSNTPAFLPLAHLSDNISNCGALLEIFSPSPGEELKSLSNILYYGRDKGKSLIVSRKQSLIKAATEGSLVNQFDDLEVGMIHPGFTRQLMPYGVFVEFSPSIYGLAPNSLLSNSYIADAGQFFEVGQSVMAKITEIDRDRRRLLVSLKSCDCYPDQSDTSKEIKDKLCVDWLVDYVKERDEILESLHLRSKDSSAFTDVAPGSMVPGKVAANENSGTTFLLENGVKGFAVPQLTRGANVTVDEVLDSFVLDYDLVNKRFDLTVDSNLIRKCKEIKSKHKKKLHIGEVVSAVVQVIHKEYLVVILPNHALRIAYVPVKETLNDVKDPTSHFKIGQQCDAIVQTYVPSKLAKREYLILSVDVNEESTENIKPGAIVNALITSLKGVYINVQFCGKKYKGRVCITELCDNVSEGENPLASYSRGQKIQVKILGFRDSVKHNFLPITHRNFAKAYAELSARPSLLREEEEEDGNNNEGKPFEKKLEDYKEGEKIFCFVKTVRDYDIWMVVSTTLNGRVTLVDISTDMEVLKDLSRHFKVGSGHQCTVLKVNQEQKSLDLSMADCEIKKGDIVAGKVTRILPSRGLTVQLPGKKYGVVFLTDICDDFKESPTEDYQLNQLVRCYILNVNDNGHIHLSTRASKTEGAISEEKCDKDIQSLNDFEEGDIVRGYVKAATDVGVFVSLSRSIVARVQIKNLSHYFVKNWKPLFPVGKLVKGKVLSIDPNNNNIELSLKGKDVGDKDPAPKPERREGKKSAKDKRQHNDGGPSESEDEGEKVLKKLRKEDDHEDEEQRTDKTLAEEESAKMSSEDDDSEEDEEVKEKPTLKIPGGFNWHSVENDGDAGQAEDGPANTDDESGEDDENNQVARKKSKRAKRAAKKAEEEFLYKTEQALLDKDQGPQTAEDFDRILLSTPNDSLLWLQYMAYYLHLTEIDRARAVAERALKSISFREESEKFNVWIGLLNLENLYGTQDSVVKVFQRALEQNEPKTVFKQLVNIYVASNKFEQAEQLYQAMIKRFKSSKKVWIDYAAYLMERGELDSARNLLQRSFKSLEKRKHIETITSFAMLEFKHGEPERGKTLLDNVLISYPKRADIWSMYVDVLVKNNEVAPARRLFDKALACKLSSKKMKFIFKKYLEFEKRHGDETTVENVKKMAEEYVQDKAA